MYRVYIFRKKRRNCGLEEIFLEEGVCVGIFFNY